MSTIDLEADPSPEELRETAAEMPTFYFLGEELKPFSFNRQAAVQRIVGGDRISNLESATLMVYVCTLDRPEIERTRTAAGREAFWKAMEQWAESKGINLRSHAGKEVERVADEIWSQLEASEGQPKPPKNKDAESPPGNESGRVAPSST